MMQYSLKFYFWTQDGYKIMCEKTNLAKITTRHFNTNNRD